MSAGEHVGRSRARGAMRAPVAVSIAGLLPSALAVCALTLGACGGGTAQAPPANATEQSAAATDDVRPAPPITGPEARQLVAAGAVLLDVRTSAEFAIRHIEGARNIPLPELEERFRELQSDMPVIVYCMSGHRSANAGRLLRANGFTYVFDLGSMVSY